jgi:predicted DCC family thiol-disulfide oxidoreductase YuxK
MSSGVEEDLRNLALSRAEAKRSVWWIDESERLAGHEAIGRALQGVGGGWALLGRAMTVAPVSWVASWTYRRVAANRHRFNK